MSFSRDNSVGGTRSGGDVAIEGQALPPSTSPFPLVAASSVLSLREHLSSPARDTSPSQTSAGVVCARLVRVPQQQAGQNRTDVLMLPGKARLYLTWLASCSLWHLYFKTHAVSFKLSELSCSAHVIISLLQPCHYTSPPPPPQTLNSVLSASFACCNYSKFLWSSNWPSTKIFSSWLFWLWKHAIEMIFSFTSLLTVLIEYNPSGHSSGGTFIFLHWQRATPG